MALVLSLAHLRSAVRFRRYICEALIRPPATPHQPRAAVILPCCGVDERLAATIEALGRQEYEDHEVFFTFESDQDPAYEAVGQLAARWAGPRWRRVLAGQAHDRSQKVHNLLAAVNEVDPEYDVLVFLDSDAVPHAGWLAALVAPLADPEVGAATGFRWYSAEGGLVNGLRSAWNAAAVAFLTDPVHNFCWGGSTAIRRDVFERCGVVERWQRALSDDYQVTLAMREAGLAIRFVPQCLIACHERTSLRQFFGFARRQLIITRVCGPALWWSAMRFVGGFTAASAGCVVFAIWGLAAGRPDAALVSLAAWVVLLMVAKIQCMLRQSAVRRALPRDWTRRDWIFDVMGVELIGILHMVLLLSSAFGRRFRWRDIQYEMVSPDETVVLRRHNRGPQSRAPAGAADHAYASSV